MSWYTEHLEAADRILIETLERALKVGVGGQWAHTRDGVTLHVLGIDETYVKIAVRLHGNEVERLEIPRAIRAAAIEHARALAEAKRAGAFPV